MASSSPLRIARGWKARACQDGRVVDPESAEVKAAGGVVWRRGEGGHEFALVHRPRYDDWSLPKGKLDPDEGWEEAAAREVQEELGAVCDLGEELTPIGYHDNKGRAKVVRYWLMEAREAADHSADPDEVDEIRWLDGEEALGLLTYPRDRGVLTEALEVLHR